MFPPTLREVMLRPRRLALLALCLAVAGVFAWLGQWQLDRAIDTAPAATGSTEQVRPLVEVVEPGDYLPEPLVGQRVIAQGWWQEDFIVVSSRFNDGVEGYWITGQLRLWDGGQPSEPPVSLAVALGWAETRADADAAAAELRGFVRDALPAAPLEVTGRLIPDEGPALPPRDADPRELTRMSPAALLGQWQNTDGLAVFRQYVTAEDPLGLVSDLPVVAEALRPISSPAPEPGSAVNWLNLFYAAEWAVFAGFAFYLWYRLARDAWEREVEDVEDAAATG